jgi:E3 ubiquitin-protein ligase NEDD4
MLTLDLKKSNNHDTIQGKLILNISTNVNAPIRNGTNTLASNSRNSVPRNVSNQSIDTTSQPQAQSSIPSAAPPPPSHTPASVSTSTEDDGRNNDLPEG